jgi:hypothetical protein
MADEPDIAGYFAQRLGAAVPGQDVVIRVPTATATAVAIAPAIEIDTAGSIRPVGTLTVKVLRGDQRTSVELNLEALGWLTFAMMLWDLYDHLAPVLGPVQALALAAAVGNAALRRRR